MCGKLNRIKIVKDLIVQKLDDILSRLSSLDTVERGINHLAENESVVFTSLIHLTNLSKDILNKIGAEFQKNEEFIKQIELSLKEFFLVYLRDTENKLDQQFKDTENKLDQQFQETRNKLEQQFTETENYLKNTENYFNNFLTQQAEEREEGFKKILSKLEEKDAITIKLSSEEPTDVVPEPDVLLMGFLYSFLPHRVALDVGANIGNVSEVLLDSGYEVYAFEPYIPTFAKLTSRLNNHPDFHPMDFAIGADDSDIDLYIAADTTGTNVYQEPSLYNTLSPHSMPPGLEFTDKISVPVRSLKSLQEDGKIPEEIGLLKIDAEGYDLEVIRGLANSSIPVVVTEFWDKNHVFAKFDAFNSVKVLAEEMRVRKYYWYIVIARKDNQHSSDFTYDVFYYCNFPRTLENSWGNVFFFNDYELFKRALDWCSTMLPMGYFK